MPKRPNAKKMASQAWSKVKSLNAAVSSGKYTVGHVTKNLGFCQFLCDVQISAGKTREITALIRGKMKGGKTCPTRVEIGHYLLLDGDMSKTMEVVGVVNRQSELDTLKGSGRVSKALMAKEADDDDLFDRSEEKDAADDIWAKKDEEREAEAAHLLGRYRRAEAGVRYRLSRVAVDEGSATAEVVVDADVDVDADAPAVSADASTDGPTTSYRPITSARRLAALAAKTAAQVSIAEAIEKEELAGIWANMVPDWIEDANVKISAPKSRAALTSWEDEIDIDAI